MNCLVLTKPTKDIHQIIEFLSGQNLKYEHVTDPFSAVQRAQQVNFDLVIICAEVEGMKVQNVIQLLYGCNPKGRIIVVAESNSKSMETSIRKEKIFYYHLNSFGMQDLTTAISSAMDLTRSNNHFKSANP